MNLRNYQLDRDRTIYEDELPEDMTMMDYQEWFDNSWIDFVRLGWGVTRLQVIGTEL
jgi:hypothetical protein